MTLKKASNNLEEISTKHLDIVEVDGNPIKEIIPHENDITSTIIFLDGTKKDVVASDYEHFVIIDLTKEVLYASEGKQFVNLEEGVNLINKKE